MATEASPRAPLPDAPPLGISAVFDLDGTLLDGDSTAHWIRMLYFRSGLRLAAGVAVASAALPLSFHRQLWRRGASALLWTATFGMDAAALAASMALFVASVREGRSRLRWRSSGLETLGRHLDAGHRVAVVTGAPALLAAALLTDRVDDPRLTILGSSLQRSAGGWGVERHCYGTEKCRYLSEAGYGDAWSFAYTDSAADTPLLLRAAQPHLVNPSTRLYRQLRARGLPALQLTSW
jgi:phosphatidylglycerophosphatase C